MITEHDLQEAIAECQGQRNPNASTCIKLAAFYILQDHMYGDAQEETPQQSYRMSFAPGAPGSTAGEVTYDSGSEFSAAIQGKNINDVLAVVDELMDAINVLHPRMYASALDKMSG